MKQMATPLLIFLLLLSFSCNQPRTLADLPDSAMHPGDKAGLQAFLARENIAPETVMVAAAPI